MSDIDLYRISNSELSGGDDKKFTYSIMNGTIVVKSMAPDQSYIPIRTERENTNILPRLTLQFLSDNLPSK